jgi:hypothetical protein
MKKIWTFVILFSNMYLNAQNSWGVTSSNCTSITINLYENYHEEASVILFKKSSDVYFPIKKYRFSSSENLLTFTNLPHGVYRVSIFYDQVYQVNQYNHWINTSNVSTDIELSCTNLRNKYEDIENIEIYPNPANSYIDISLSLFDLSLPDNKVIIYDFRGNMVNNFSILNNQIRVNIENYNSGIYFVFFQTKYSSIVKKFIKL